MEILLISFVVMFMVATHLRNLYEDYRRKLTFEGRRTSWRIQIVERGQDENGNFVVLRNGLRVAVFTPQQMELIHAHIDRIP